MTITLTEAKAEFDSKKVSGPFAERNGETVEIIGEKIASGTTYYLLQKKRNGSEVIFRLDGSLEQSVSLFNFMVGWGL
jgi:arginyl-tRNA synthetase